MTHKPSFIYRYWYYICAVGTIFEAYACWKFVCANDWTWVFISAIAMIMYIIFAIAGRRKLCGKLMEM